MPVRSFRDPDGREWSVWDVVPSRKSDIFLPATMVEGWLCFEAADEKRRLHPVRVDWEVLDSGGLWGLCQRAALVKPRTRRAAAFAAQREAEPA